METSHELLVANSTSPHFLEGSKCRVPGLSWSQVQHHITQLLATDAYIGTNKDMEKSFLEQMSISLIYQCI